ncbi:MAG TPA: transporter substrate-binding domain-containing protein [Chloroflexi bacterium]|nr:transporter substrate-binding domain-containing protein [Chloroflexota bacterium]
MTRTGTLWFALIGVLLAAALFAVASSPGLYAAPGAQDAPAQPDTPLGLSPLDSSADWKEIQATGVLTVGTSSGSPPFAFYDAAFNLDGFDVALMQAVADKLGLELAMVDYAFEGLPAALQLGEIDAIAAALTETAARAKAVDFSMPYYTSAEAILAPAGSPLTAVDLKTQDFAGIRIGVQRGTIYELWVKQFLVDAGRMPAANVQNFAREADIIQALEQERIDLALIDLLPAQEYLRQGGVQLAGEGQLAQQYAVAVRKGSSFLPYLNLALTQLQQDGTYDALVAKYLRADEQPAPPPTPAPPVPGCLDNMAYVADLTYDDNTAIPFVAPGQPFVKTWRVLNNGTCTWQKGYALTYAPMPGATPTNQMGGVPLVLSEAVQPGQTYDLSLNLVAPVQPGQYTGVWQMVNAQGQPFGQKVWVRVQVPIGPNPPPPPTATPIQGIDFTVDRTNIRSGECVNFRWNVTNVAAVFFYKEGQDFRQHGVAGQSGQNECPQHTTTYYLHVDKRDGTAVVPAITIYVQSDPDAPYIQSFSANPSRISAGACTTIGWQVLGQVTSVTIKRNGRSWWDGAPASGSQQDCLGQPGDYTYEIEARGPGGKTKQTVTVRVASQPGPTPTPTPFNPAPVPAVIDYFTVQPDQIMVGDCVNASWSVSAGVTRVEVRVDDTPVGRNLPFVSSQQLCPAAAPNSSVKFTLYAEGMTGTPPQSQDVYVQVLGPAPEPTATPAPPPTPVPEPPIIDYFSADNYNIQPGGCAYLSWNVSGWVDVVQLYRNGGYLTDVGANDGRSECLSDPGSYTYRLRAANSGGAEVTQELTITVEMMPGPIPTDEPLPPDPQPDPPAPEPEPDNPEEGASDGG